MSSRRFQTKLDAGVIVLPSTNRQLSDHVTTAIAKARSGRRAWIKSKDPLDPSSVFYAVEFKLVDDVVRITIFEDHYIVAPEAPTTPGWCREIATIARNMLCAV